VTNGWKAPRIVIPKLEKRADAVKRGGGSARKLDAVTRFREVFAELRQIMLVGELAQTSQQRRLQ
jgi:hypothetical protein